MAVYDPKRVVILQGVGEGCETANLQLTAKRAMGGYILNSIVLDCVCLRERGKYKYYFHDCDPGTRFEASASTPP